MTLSPTFQSGFLAGAAFGASMVVVCLVLYEIAVWWRQRKPLPEVAPEDTARTDRVAPLTLNVQAERVRLLREQCRLPEAAARPDPRVADAFRAHAARRAAVSGLTPNYPKADPEEETRPMPIPIEEDST